MVRRQRHISTASAVSPAPSCRNQTGNVPIMNWSELHHAAQKVAGKMRFTGDLDDFLMTHITDPIFKRWVLVSLGYVFHVSASEIALNAPRGAASIHRRAWMTMLARMGERVKDPRAARRDHVGHSAMLQSGDQAHSVPEAAKSFNQHQRPADQPSRFMGRC